MAGVQRYVGHSVLIGFLLAVAGNASAEAIKCERTIAKASSKFAQDKSKALQSCEDKIAAGKLTVGTNCLTETKTASKIQKAADKLAKSVRKDCGGKDKTCGNADDDTLASIGWGSITTCPNFENGSCNGPITDCDDIITCLTCVDEAAVDQAIDLYYDELESGQFGTNSTTNKCQRAIGKETTKFLKSKSKALQKCWDARLKGKHSNPCPNPGDSKAVAAIQKAEDKKVANICKACGGGNKACGGGDDLTPGQIGFASTCPDVTIPEGSSCGGAIVDLQDIVDCVDCVTEFKVDCMDRLTVPEFESYPSECNGETSTTTTSSTTTTTQPGLCGNGVLDPGEECDSSSPGGGFLCDPGEVCSSACICESTTTTTEATTSTTSTSTSTTTQPGTCGNGVLDPGEECDSSSPGGGFLCDPGEVCSAACICESTTTTTEATTSTTSTSTSTTTQPGTCGNGVLDPGEECDSSSPGGGFLCDPGEVCSAACICEPTTTTTTTQPGSCGNGVLDPGEECDSSSPGGGFLCDPGEVCSAACICEPTTTTTTTQPGSCGNGVLDPGEECDSSSPGGSFLCEPGEACSAACICEPTTTTTEATTSTTSTSTSTSTSGTDATTSSSTTTLPSYGSASRAFLSTPDGLLD